MTIRKGSSYRDRPPHDKTEETRQFERELDAGIDGLSPCPFCGGEASKRLFYKGKYRVHCNACDAHSGDVCDTEAEAIAAWNTRADYHGYEHAAIEAWESIKAWNTRAELGSGTCEMEQLIRDMHRECTACGYSCRTDNGECGIIQRIRELGIEVDA